MLYYDRQLLYLWFLFENAPYKMLDSIILQGCNTNLHLESFWKNAWDCHRHC